MYVIFEGVDTSGKSTQIELLKESYKNAIFTKEPGGTDFGKKVREMILNGEKISKTTEMFLFLADRSEHFHQIIKPNSHELIISDRGFISGMAYALANKDVDFESLKMLNSLALEKFLPQKVVLFWTDEKLIKQRMSIKKEDNIEQRGINYLLLVQENMLKVINELKLDFLQVNSHESIESINKQIKEYLNDTSA